MNSLDTEVKFKRVRFSDVAEVTGNVNRDEEADVLLVTLKKKRCLFYFLNSQRSENFHFRTPLLDYIM